VTEMNSMFRGATLFNQDLTSWHERVNEIVGYPDTRDAERVDIFHESGMQLINYPRFGIEERLRIGNENRANFDYLSTLASVEARRNPDNVDDENRVQALRTMRERFQAAEYGDPEALYKFGGKKKRKSKRRKSLKKKQRKTKRKGRK